MVFDKNLRVPLMALRLGEAFFMPPARCPAGAGLERVTQG